MYRSIARVIQRVVATPTAEALIARLQAEHGTVMFFQPGGCREGDSPLCIANDECLLEPESVYLGNLTGVPFYIHSEQFDAWKDMQIIVDVTEGLGNRDSLESGSGKCFVTRCRSLSGADKGLLSEPASPSASPAGDG